MTSPSGSPGRIRAVFGLDPVDMSFGTPKAGAKLANIGIPIAFIGETVDKFSCAAAWFNYQALYDAAASPAAAITALDADHTMFQDPGNCNFCSARAKGTANPSTVLGYSVRYLTAFFARELLGDKSVGAVFEGAGAAADVKAGLIQSPRRRPPHAIKLRWAAHRIWNRNCCRRGYAPACRRGCPLRCSTGKRLSADPDRLA